MQTALRRLPDYAVVTIAVLLAVCLPTAYIVFLLRAAPGAAWQDVRSALLLSVALAAGALLIVAPLALGYGLALYDMKPSFVKRALLRAVYLLGSVPPIVCALTVIAPIVALGGRPSPLLALCALALSALPRACRMASGAVRDVPERYILAGMSLGASRRDATLSIALRFARGKLLSALLIMMTFAIDQLALMQLALGFAPTLTASSGRTLAPLLLNSVQVGDRATAAVSALTLIALSCGLSLWARVLARRSS